MIRRAALGVIVASVGFVAGCREPTVVDSTVTSAQAPRAEPAVDRSETRPGVDTQGCVDSVAELPDSPLFDRADPRLHEPALLVARKSARRLMLFAHGARQQCLRTGLGFDPESDKQVEGDGRTPEGWYRTSDKPWSDFAGAIAIHYPNRRDALRGRAAGSLSPEQYQQVLESLAHDGVPPQQTNMGGEVLIHGGGSGRDWTLGCMALDDQDLSRLRAALPEGQRVSLLILP